MDAGPIPRPPVKLSQREIDVIQMLADGMTYKEIGQHLKFHPNTAMSYAKSARHKLNLRTVWQTVAHLVRQGIID